VAGLRGVTDELADRVLMGEIYLPVERLVAYYGVNLEGVQLPFNFQLLQAPWNARGVAQLIDEYEGKLPPGGWPNWVLGNHDRPRIASRVGIDQARVAAMLLLTLRGTPTLYYADELGMSDVPIPADRVQDPLEKNVPGLGLGRDPCRTPMQWNAGAHSGFSTAEPWLPVSDDYSVVNVESEDADPESILTLYRRLLALRRAHPALSVGKYEPVAMTGHLLAYVREEQPERFFVALNFGEDPYELSLETLAGTGRIMLSTYLDRDDDDPVQSVGLRANEGVVVRLAGERS